MSPWGPQRGSAAVPRGPTSPRGPQRSSIAVQRCPRGPASPRGPAWQCHPEVQHLEDQRSSFTPKVQRLLEAQRHREPNTPRAQPQLPDKKATSPHNVSLRHQVTWTLCSCPGQWLLAYVQFLMDVLLVSPMFNVFCSSFFIVCVFLGCLCYLRSSHVLNVMFVNVWLTGWTAIKVQKLKLSVSHSLCWPSGNNEWIPFFTRTWNRNKRRQNIDL